MEMPVLHPPRALSHNIPFQRTPFTSCGGQGGGAGPRSSLPQPPAGFLNLAPSALSPSDSGFYADIGWFQKENSMKSGTSVVYLRLQKRHGL